VNVARPALDAPEPVLPAREVDEREPAPLDGGERRALTALLRERAHHLPRSLPPRLVGAARLLPALLHASFDQPPLDADAPGVAGLRYRRRWSSLARAFALSPPCRQQRQRFVVEAILAIPTADGLDALVLAVPGLAAAEQGALQQRLDGVRSVFARARAPVRATLLDPTLLAQDREACHRVIAFGALLAGHLSAAAWSAFGGARRPLPRLATSALAASAPAPLATLALTLMTRWPCPAPLEAALALLAAGTSPRRLASAEEFCVRWAGLVPGLGALLEETMLLARPAPGPAAAGELSQLVEHGRALARACAAAIRASGGGRADRVARRRWREAIGPGMPRVLLPALGARLAEEAAAGHLGLEPTRVGRAYEVQLPEGARLGRGATPVQARLRALGLVAAAHAALPAGSRDSLLAGLDVTWRAVGQRLSRSREHAELVMVVVAGGGARPGPPMDLLNRGPARALEFDGALSLLLSPGQRPAGRMLAPDEAIRAILRRATAGGSLEVLAAQSAARPVAARLAQISALLRDPSAPRPIAIEAGGRVLVPRGEALRDFPLERFVARPRAFTPDPDAPDISITTGERHGLRSLPSGFVQCRVGLVDTGRAALLYANDAGTYLREVVPLSSLEERLRDAREIVRAATPPAVLAMRLSDGVEPALRRAGPPGPRVEVTVRGALPFVEIEIGGEHFGGTSPLGWDAAAEALLARCPAGADPVVAVSAVTATALGNRLSPLLALYASAVARRRLRAHLARAMASYRTVEVSRKDK
jgi:hypothetical protein